MKKLLNEQGSEVTLSAATDQIVHKGDLDVYVKGTFATVKIHYSPTKPATSTDVSDFVEIADITAEGLSKVWVANGVIRVTVDATASGVNVFAG